MDIIKFNQIEQEAIDFGFDWPNVEMILDQIQSECLEVKEAITQNEGEVRIKEEIGDLLHSIFSLCKFLNYDGPEILEEATDKFAKRFYRLKELVEADGYNNLQGEPIEILLKYWRMAKK